MKSPKIQTFIARDALFVLLITGPLALRCATYPTPEKFQRLTTFGYRWTIHTEAHPFLEKLRQLARKARIQLKEETVSDSEVAITTQYVDMKRPRSSRIRVRMAYYITFKIAKDGKAQDVIVACRVQTRGIYERTWRE